MKAAQEWRDELAGVPPREEVQLVEGRQGKPTLTVGGVFLHSRYNPEQEAARLIESAALDPERPVLVVGLGLGYHVQALLSRGFEVAVAEPDPLVAKLALETMPADTQFSLWVGDAEALAAAPGFAKLAARMPQVLTHPPTAHIHPGHAEAVSAQASKAALGKQHLSIAIVGPLYGGSLPITKYLADAFERLGHSTLLVPNDSAWPFYQELTGDVQDQHASSQLGRMMANLLSEWTYARVAEFNPEICIVMAQAPVGLSFPLRLRKAGIVTAFWYVENWRHLPYWRDLAPCYDYFFHIQPGEFEEKLDEAGCQHHAFVQTACDPQVHRPVDLSPEERGEYECGLSFAGAGYYNRLQLFKGLTDYAFKIWGVDWAERDLARLVVGGERRFDSESFMKMVAGSAISLNLHSSRAHDGVDPKCDAINPRVFEIAAAGGFQLCDPCIGLEDHFDFETELPVYHDLKELREKIDYYLAHPEERKAIAIKARERALRDHSYENRAQQMLGLILERHGAGILRRGIRVQRTVSEMADLLGPETELAAWLAALPPETPFLYDAVMEHLPTTFEGASRPEKVLSYMREVREFAETLLKGSR